MNMLHGLLNTIVNIQIELSSKLGDEYSDVIDNIIALLKEVLIKLIKGGLDISIYILRPLYILLIILGITKYAVSGLSPRSRDILLGGLILAAFTEFILPILLQNINL